MHHSRPIRSDKIRLRQQSSSGCPPLSISTLTRRFRTDTTRLVLNWTANCMSCYMVSCLYGMGVTCLTTVCGRFWQSQLLELKKLFQACILQLVTCTHTHTHTQTQPHTQSLPTASQAGFVVKWKHWRTPAGISVLRNHHESPALPHKSPLRSRYPCSGATGVFLEPQAGCVGWGRRRKRALLSQVTRGESDPGPPGKGRGADVCQALATERGCQAGKALVTKSRPEKHINTHTHIPLYHTHKHTHTLCTTHSEVTVQRERERERVETNRQSLLFFLSLSPLFSLSCSLTPPWGAEPELNRGQLCGELPDPLSQVQTSFGMSNRAHFCSGPVMWRQLCLFMFTQILLTLILFREISANEQELWRLPTPSLYPSILSSGHPFFLSVPIPLTLPCFWALH